MSIPDPIGELRTLLLDDPAVAALVAERVFGGALPAGETPSMPRSCVVVSPAGGRGRPGTVKYRRPRVDTTCYGATVNEAWQVHLAVREALETMNRRSGSLLSIETNADGALATDPVKHWPTCYASYLVLSSTEA